MKAKTILIIVLVVLSLIVILQNSGIVTFHLLFWQISMSRVLMFSFLLLMGFLIGVLVSSPLFRPQKPGRRS